MSKKILLVIGSQGFRDEEFFIPKELFKKAGLSIVIASEQRAATSKISKEKITADILFKDAMPQDYDCVTFIGGPGAEPFLRDPHAHAFVWDMYNQGKIVSAICIAPLILSNAGLLTGKASTVWIGAKQEFCKGICLYKESGVITDGRIITASGPEYSKEFAEAIIKKLCNF